MDLPDQTKHSSTSCKKAEKNNNPILRRAQETPILVKNWPKKAQKTISWKTGFHHFLGSNLGKESVDWIFFWKSWAEMFLANQIAGFLKQLYLDNETIY